MEEPKITTPTQNSGVWYFRSNAINLLEDWLAGQL